MLALSSNYNSNNSNSHKVKPVKKLKVEDDKVTKINQVNQKGWMERLALMRLIWKSEIKTWHTCTDLNCYQSRVRGQFGNIGYFCVTAYFSRA